MCARLLLGVAALLILSPALPQADVGHEPSQILKKLGDVDQRLNRIEQDIRQLHAAVARLAQRKAAVDVRQTPEYRALQERFNALQEKIRAEAQRNPAEIWHAMGDPKELSQRLDTLLRAFAPTLSQPDKRNQFEQDVRSLKKKIGKQVPDQELYQKVREALSERIARTQNDREKAWLRRQLDTLQRSAGPDRKARLDRYLRIRNVRAVHELAQKYSIPREQMVKCGLAFVGYPRRPTRKFEPRNKGGPPRARPRRGPRPGEDKRRPPI